MISATVMLEEVSVRLESGDIAVNEQGRFDASAVTIVLDGGTLSGSGVVNTHRFSFPRSFDLWPAAVENTSVASGFVGVTPTAGGGFDIVVNLPLELCAPVSTETGLLWLQVENSELDLLSPDDGGTRVPALAPWATIVLVLSLPLVARVVAARRMKP